jgi:hypothetical protein
VRETWTCRVEHSHEHPASRSLLSRGACSPSATGGRLLHLDGQVHRGTHALHENYVIEARNYKIVDIK